MIKENNNGKEYLNHYSSLQDTFLHGTTTISLKEGNTNRTKKSAQNPYYMTRMHNCQLAIKQ